jgi:hypothetical protein
MNCLGSMIASRPQQLSGLAGGVIMQKVIELSCEETKEVVGGAAVAKAELAMRRESPLVEFIRLVVRDFEDVFGGRQTAKLAQY